MLREGDFLALPGRFFIMNPGRWIIPLMAALGIGFVALAGTALSAPGSDPVPSPTPVDPPVTITPATADELRQAYEEWQDSGHADTYHGGLGANTTCAKCKSPMNWDPGSPLQEAAQDCGSCKRIPGAPRPDLPGGVPVPEEEWRNIGCEICHQPIGDSFSREVFFWNQETGSYDQVASVAELCAKCHHGQHGFEVVEEQQVSPAHNNWECTECHGPHGASSACVDCHDPFASDGAFEHERHPSVNCTACHDQGRLSIWLDLDPTSDHYGTYIPRRFAHDLTSWPSHNIGLEVDCLRCHHPPKVDSPVVVPEVSCRACHPHQDGATFFWCDFMPRDPDPSSR
jgi:hypothetical protein